MRATNGRRDDGFTMIELVVVLLVVAVLLAIAIPTFAVLQNGAQDAAAQSLARNALNVELLYHVQNGEFTANRRALEELEPSLEWNQGGNPPGTVRIRRNRNRAEFEVCIYTQSETGTWFAVYRNQRTGTVYGRPDRLRGCSANVVTRRWEEGW